MWLKKAHAGCRHWSTSAERDVFDGWHDGYMRLGDPVLHRRRITLDKPARRFRIEDVLEAAAANTNWSCSSIAASSVACIPIPQGYYALSQGPWRLILRLPRMQGAICRLYCGSDSPVAGWVSRQFDHKQPTQTIAWRYRFVGRLALNTEISVRMV